MDRKPKPDNQDSFHLNLNPDNSLSLMMTHLKSEIEANLGQLNTIWSCDELDCASSELNNGSKSVEKDDCSRYKTVANHRLMKPPSREDWHRVMTEGVYDVNPKSFDLSSGKLQVYFSHVDI